MSELPVPSATPPEPPRPQTYTCANCGAELSGEYCAACGQRHEPHIHSVAHFAGEAFESISHADSRLWRTLWYLFSRPGFLTREFFAGRRVAYLPPFRLYLVLSVLVFLFSTLSSDDPAMAARPLQAGAAAAAVATPLAQAEAEKAMQETGIQTERDEKGMRLRVQGLDEFCQPFEKPETGGSGATSRSNIRQFCNRVRNDTSELFTALWHNLPRAMFIFLPLLAGIMKLMYWRPKRYYVEHLLFLVHNHAAVFLVIVLLILFSFLPWLGDFTPLLVFVSLGYMVWYIYRAMRNVYGQHGALTFAKYFVLGWTYIVTAITTVVLTLVFLALIG
jgi:hypothetical protein